jgi:NAD(P)-dependent dehydrogenase (short-subunit alcohol dehydrogenase family)
VKVGIAGGSSRISQRFVEHLPAYVDMVAAERSPDNLPLDLDCYLICSGYLAGKALEDIDADELRDTWDVNFVSPARFCDRLFALNPAARVAIIGSESGIKGSFDMAYAGAKAAIHLYIQTKKLTGDQVLVGIAPWIVGDAGMTMRRKDPALLDDLRSATRRGRFITAAEVASVAHTALFGPTPFISNSIIRLKGEA